jgi:hypothetical protein
MTRFTMLGLALTLLGCDYDAPPEEGNLLRRGGEVTSITLHYRSLPAPGAERTRTLTMPDDIRGLIGSLYFLPTKPCRACVRREWVVFRTRSRGDLEVSLCDRGFRFAGREYRMPLEFYHRFRSLLGLRVTD